MTRLILGWSPLCTSDYVDNCLTCFYSVHSPEGVILWTGRRDWSAFTDWFSLGLSGGHLVLAYNLGKTVNTERPLIQSTCIGSGEVRIDYNSTRIDDGSWHSVEISRQRREASLKVDHYQVHRANSPGFKIQLNTRTGLFLGESANGSLKNRWLF